VSRRRRALLPYVTAALLTATPAAAQGPPEPPGPYVVDVRIATSGVPQDAALLVPAPTVIVASRGTGVEAGVHVYAGRLGASHLGFGVTVIHVAGTETGTPGSEVTLRSYSPQLSFNFGTADGWSYLSTGVGVSELRIDTIGDAGFRGETGRVLTVNAGAGARWFLSRHVGVGFDLRLHRLSASDTMSSSLQFALSAGVSLR
jgi:hypothetical protein